MMVIVGSGFLPGDPENGLMDTDVFKRRWG